MQYRAIRSHEFEPGLKLCAIAGLLGLLLLVTKAPAWAYLPSAFGLGYSAATARRAIK